MKMLKNRLVVLLVDDDEDEYILLRDMVRTIHRANSSIYIELEWTSSMGTALHAGQTRPYDLFLVDYYLGKDTGIDLMRGWASMGIHVPTILLTGQSSYELDMAAMQEGAADFLTKRDLTPPLLERSIRYALEHRRAQEELELRVLERTRELARANQDLKAEIAAREKVEQALLASQARLTVMAETTSAAILIIQNGHIRYANTGARFVTGYSPEDLTKMEFWQLAHPNYQKRLREEGLPRAWADSIPARFEIKILKRTGEERWVDITAGNLDYDGTAGILVTAFDITDRDRAEKDLQQAKVELEQRVIERTEALRQALQLAEERSSLLEAIYSAMPEPLLVFDSSSRLVRVNPAFELRFGFDPLGKTQKQLHRLLHPRRGDGSVVSLKGMPAARALLGETASGERFTMRSQSGSEFDVQISASPIYTPRGELSGAVSAWHDVTERERLVAQLETERTRLNSVVENAPGAIVMADRQGNIILANPVAIQMLGLQAGPEGQTLTLPPLFSPNREAYQPEELILVRAVREDEPIRNIEMLIFPPNQPARTILAHAAPIHDRQGHIYGAVGVFQDISDRKRREEEIQQSAAQAEVLAALSQAFAQTGLDYAAVLETAARKIAESLGDGCIIRLLDIEGEILEPVALHFNSSLLEPTGPEMMNIFREKISDGEPGRTVRTGQPLVLLNTNQSEVERLFRPAVAQLLGKLAVHSLLIVPLRSREDYIGTLTVLRSQTSSPYSLQDLTFFQNLADRTALAIENARLHSQVKQQAVRDALTGQYNRRAFFELGQIEMDRFLQTSKPLSAIMLDIDRFKTVNDRFGHKHGDEILRNIITLCSLYIRETDILGRYGGDEFAILLPGTRLPTARVVAERIRTAVEEFSMQLEDETAKISISAGVAEANAEMEDVEALLNLADEALYNAKRLGRNRVEVI